MFNINEVLQNNSEALSKFFSENKELYKIKTKLLSYTGLTEYNKKIIATGHQPIFYYPSILCKNYFVSKIAKERDSIPVNLVVDTDEADMSFPVIAKLNNHFIKKICKISNHENLCFTDFNPDIKIIKSMFVTAEKAIKTLKNENVKINFKNYVKNFLQFYHKNNNFVDTSIILRKEFEKSLDIFLLDIKVSEISFSISFYNYFWHIITKIEEFIEVYNHSILNKKFKEVKPLEKEKNIYELPFWYYENGKRFKLYVKKINNALKFLSEKKEIFSLVLSKFPEQIIPDILSKNIKIFPKAVTLSLFFRIFFADLFIHGTGGAKYDKITDFIIKEFFKIENLKYIIVTGNITFPFEIDIKKIENDYKEKKEWVSNAFYNPAKLMDEKLADYYKNQKKELYQKLKNTSDSQERKILHKKLKQIDNEMRSFFKDRIKLIKEELEEYKKILSQKDVFIEKKYPYFIYPADTNFEELISKNIETKVAGN